MADWIFEDETEKKETIWDKICIFGNKIKSIYKTFTAWFFYNWNRPYFKLLWQTAKLYPFEYSYKYPLDITYLKYLKKDIEKNAHCIEEQKNHILRWLNLAIRILEISENESDMFEYTGVVRIRKSETHPDCSTIDTSESKYICKVNVNIGNMLRFISPKYVEVYKMQPHELYIKKLKHLYYKILFEHADEWWE